MLKMTTLFKLILKTLQDINNEIIKVGDSGTNKMVKILFKFKTLKNTKSEIKTYIETLGKFIFLTFDAKKTLNYLK